MTTTKERELQPKIINTVNMDGRQHNIVMSADVKQETEKGHNVRRSRVKCKWSRQDNKHV